jgi:hypothetical protein
MIPTDMVGTRSGGCGVEATMMLPTTATMAVTSTHNLMQQYGEEIGKIC